MISAGGLQDFRVPAHDDNDDEIGVSYYQTARDWRNCIFVQFTTLWKVVICTGILTNIVLVLYFLVFSENSFAIAFLVPFYTFELMYFVDISLNIMHRIMVTYRSTRLHRPKPLLQLIVDIISILPYYEIYCIALRTSLGPDYVPMADYMKFKVYLRLPYVLSVYIGFRFKPRGNQLFAVVLGQMFFFIVFVMTMASVWFWLKDQFEETWSMNLTLYEFDRDDPLHWLMVCVSVIGGCFMHNWAGNIGSENGYEYAVLIATVVTGFLFHIIIFFGDLTAQYITVFKQQIGFSSRLNVIATILEDWKINNATIKRTVDHYNKFWEIRRAKTRIPEIFHRLPLAMQKDVMLDMFWESLEHTHFFKNCDINFKRSLCLGMKPEVYLPGDVVVPKGKMKTKMYYVSAGVIQILGTNQRSALISFSSGTVIGEVCALIPMVSHVTVKCQTYCEIYSLDIMWLCRVLTQYKRTAGAIKHSLGCRLVDARHMQDGRLLKMKNKPGAMTTMRWIKTQWNYFYTQSTQHWRNDSVQQRNVSHTCKYLDLYALSDEVELKIDVICLKSKFPCVLDEKSSFQRFSFYVVLVAASLQCIIVPYVVFFVKDFAVELTGLLYVLDFCYIYGLYIELSTAFRIEQRVITDSRKILLHKLKKFSTIIDILSTLPLELFGRFMHSDPRITQMMHLNRILKVQRMVAAMQMAEKNLWLNPLRLKVARYSLIIVYMIYFLCAVMYGVACPDDCLEYGWYRYNVYVEKMLQNHELSESETPSAFLTSFSYTISVFLSVTDSMYLTYVPSDMAIEFVVSFIGYSVYIFCISEVAASAVVQMIPNVKHFEHITKIKYVVSQYQLPSDIKKLFYGVSQCHWDYCKRFVLTGNDGIMGDAPENIKNLVLYERLVKCLNETPYFTYLGNDLLWNIAPIIAIHYVPPGTVLCRELAHASHMQVILRGYARCTSTIPTDEVHGYTSIFKPYDIFPILGLSLNTLTYTRITAITYVEVAVVSYEKVIGQLKSKNMTLYNLYMQAVEDHRNENDIILMRRTGRLPEMVASKRSYGKGEYFEYETNENFDDSPIDKNVMGPYLKLGKWKCFRYFFLPCSISPTKTFYTVWEVIRCVLISLNIIYVFFFFKHCQDLRLAPYVELCFFLVFLADTFIRMHCQYYDDNGILITHPLSTTKHYLSGAFIVDFYANIPYMALQFERTLDSPMRWRVGYVLMLLSRPVGVYRIYRGISYIEQKSSDLKSMIMNRLKNIIVALIILCIITCMLEHFTCDFINVHDYRCSNHSWIALSPFNGQVDFVSMMVICFYETITLMTCGTSGTFLMRTYTELVINIINIAILSGVRLLILVTVLALSIRGNAKLVAYQHNVKVMIKFMREKLMSEEIIKEVTDHYENLYTKTQGTDVNAILTIFFPMLFRDICNTMYRTILRSAKLFEEANDADIRYICHLATEAQFKKDADIIRSNQVQNNIYIVYKGFVNIYIAHTSLEILDVGGMFGCFQPRRMRQTITARAMVHVELLVINSSTLWSSLERYPKVKRGLKKLQMANIEYLSALKSSSTGTNMKQFPVGGRTALLETEKNYMYKLLFNSTCAWYSWYEYLLMMHIAPIASMFTISYIINHSLPLHTIWVIYLIDCVFFTKIILAFFMTYVERETGLTVRSFSQIAKRYFLKLDGFTVDMITCAPVELICSFFTEDAEMQRFYLLNRSLRFLHTIFYYNRSKNKLTVTKLLKWTFLWYVLLLLLHFMSCIWFLVSCPNRICNIITAGDENASETDGTQNENLYFRITYQYVLSTFTSTGIRDQMPSTIGELLVSICMMFIFYALVIAFQAEFATLLSIGKYVMNKYGEMADNLLIYMKSTHVSISLINKVDTYLHYLWIHHSGNSMPVLINQAPYYLKQDIMFQLYGHHFINHPLFSKTHIDFLKQVVMHMKPQVFLPEQYIIKKGDVDSTMYFISKGEVKELETINNLEYSFRIMKEGDSFGVQQGFMKVAHIKTVQATICSSILCLHTSDWEYLLESFPASKETLSELISKIPAL